MAKSRSDQCAVSTRVRRHGWSRLCRQLANGLLAVVVLVSGYNLMLRPHMGGATYAGSLELIPRLLLGGILINTAAGWCRLAIDPNNAMCVYGTEQIGVSDRHLVLSQLIARAAPARSCRSVVGR